MIQYTDKEIDELRWAFKDSLVGQIRIILSGNYEETVKSIKKDIDEHAIGIKVAGKEVKQKDLADFWDLFLKVLFEDPLVKMPLYVNDEHLEIKIISAWRMKKGK